MKSVILLIIVFLTFNLCKSEDLNLKLTQKALAELFQTSRENITMHLKNIFTEGELEENSVCKDFLHTTTDGKNYKTKFYSLDAIIAVGYRVNSKQATHFRIWAAQTLKEFIIKGFVLDDELHSVRNVTLGKENDTITLQSVRIAS